MAKEGDEYRAFLEDRLKVEQCRLQLSIDAMKKRIHLFDDFILSLQTLQSQDIHCFSTQVDIGAEVSKQAVVDDARTVFVDIGLNVFVSFSLPEAIQKVSCLRSELEQRLESLLTKIGPVDASVSFMEEGLRLLNQ